jgi:cytochrome c biogenesis protein CcmG/thiol:disulfide interchange protein DsbE
MGFDDMAQKSLKPLIALNIALCFVIGGILWFIIAKPDFSPKKIPEFGMQSLEGGSFGSADLKDQKMLVNIFASWCAPCRAEHDVLMMLSRDHNIPIYGIALMDKPEDTKKFLDELGNPFKAVGLDLAGIFPKTIGVSGVPTTLVVDQDLNIEMVYQMPLTTETAKQKIVPIFKTP